MVPQSTGKSITLQPRDWMWLQKLKEHGPLPSSFLTQYCKDTHRSAKKAQERLADLFHENKTVDGGTYLTRPRQQEATVDARYKQLVYDLAKAGKAALAREYPKVQSGNARAGPWVHQCMVACITASIELACKLRDDINYIPASAIFARAKTELRYPVTYRPAKGAPNQTKNLIPDAVFGLEYVRGEKRAYRFFVVEADRATEPATSGDFDRKSTVRGALQYQAYIERGLYKEHLKLTAPLLVLNVTASAKREELMLKTVGDLFPAGNSYMLFQHWEDFGDAFKPPEPNFGLLGSQWRRPKMEPLKIG